MLAISIILIVWLGLWLFFAWQKYEMMQVITGILLDLHEWEEEKRNV